MIDYVTQVASTPDAINAEQWDALLDAQEHRTPFMRHAYLAALLDSGSANAASGWDARFFTLRDARGLVGACVLYLKSHSYGEYVFDWAWASAYQQHGLPYYPKAIIAIPFTPVPGTRLMAVDDDARQALLAAVMQWCKAQGMSSLHLLFGAKEDMLACKNAGLLSRHTVQFHWQNAAEPFLDFEHFLQSLTQEKRKKIRQERRKVSAEGISFGALRGSEISPNDWDFFYRCYERTYLEHGSRPYLSREFFSRMAESMSENWLLFIGSRNGKPLCASLVALQAASTSVDQPKVAYGRYWGALERVTCLHFEACYYTPLEWCITHGYERFEGGAQGEHKMARALMPAVANSAHWLAEPDFAEAVARFLAREDLGVSEYLQDLQARSPYR